MRSAGVLVGITLVTSIALPASAQGATLEVRETLGQDAVTYIADDGETNKIVMSFVRKGSGSERAIVVTDPGPLSLGAGYKAIEGGASCATDRLPRVDVDLGDGADRFRGGPLQDGVSGKIVDPVVVDGGEGGDVIKAFSAFSCVDGEAGADRIQLYRYDLQNPSGSCFVFGGEGDDRITGSGRSEFIEAGPGKDTILGLGSRDSIGGGAGADTIQGGSQGDEIAPGSGGDDVHGDEGDDDLILEYPPPPDPDGRDVLEGGAGRDHALYLCGGCRLSLDGKFNDGVDDERDGLDVENVTLQSLIFSDEIPMNYGPGHDVLEGGNGNEVLKTKRGDDELIGGGGEDDLDSGRDDDSVRAADGERDEVNCGTGEDVASIDEFDDVRNCEVTAEVVFDRRRLR